MWYTKQGGIRREVLEMWYTKQDGIRRALMNVYSFNHNRKLAAHTTHARTHECTHTPCAHISTSTHAHTYKTHVHIPIHNIQATIITCIITTLIPHIP